ncbi:MAG: HIT family protein [Prevotellaceae bacterium]|jgi:histidine triad (HIT) family protein|nr:HIT family protein [Prevotellaceae bacterium]
MASIFTKIINGEIPCYKLAEDDRYIAFLDIRPVTKGHALVVPKEETDYLFDLPPDTLGGLMPFAQRVAAAIRAAAPCKRIGVAVLGMEVPHAHVHLIPLNAESDLDFRKASSLLSPEEMDALAARIRSYFQ